LQGGWFNEVQGKGEVGTAVDTTETTETVVEDVDGERKEYVYDEEEEGEVQESEGRWKR
jgi:hypothetical protein